MPRLVKNRLTATRVKAITEPGTYSDGDGLALSVAPGGSKLWRFRYRIKGKSQSISLGPVRHVSLAEARAKTAELLAMVREGNDPKAPNEDEGVPTFEAATAAYIEMHEPTWKNAKHRQQWRNTMATYVFPKIGGTRVNLLTPAMVAAVLQPIWLSKPETARRVKQRIHAVMDREITLGNRSRDNPADAVRQALPRQKDRAKHHTALPYAEMPAFVARLRASRGQIVSRLALEFLILTATRTSETLGAEWGEIEGDVWTIPAERMKAGREHRVPLPERCLEILDEAPRFRNTPYIFPGQKWQKPLSNMAFLQLLKRMNVKTTAHGFRSTFRDWAEETTSASHAVCEAALAHTVKNKTEAAYRRTDLFDQRRALMARWGAFLSGESGEVVALRAHLTNI